ncbi:MAG: hypothetical protein H0X16_08770 [Chloroflexi bacterium]|nr:hypothetical protein [Chloroflexota bacterium]
MDRANQQPKEPAEVDATESGQQPPEDDTEGHNMFRMDIGTAGEMARMKRADVDRDLRERQRAKEARPNRPSR